jgi:hypothetical protein
MSITPFKSDFIGPIEETNVKELNAVKDAIPIKGIGLVEWTIEDWNHQVGQIQTQAYYFPESTIRLYKNTSKKTRKVTVNLTTPSWTSS